MTASADRDWEACMTFNGISWGYVDSRQAAPYSYNAQRILKMLNTCAAGGGQPAAEHRARSPTARCRPRRSSR